MASVGAWSEELMLTNPTPCSPQLQARLGALESLVLGGMREARGRGLELTVRKTVDAALRTAQRRPDILTEIIQRKKVSDTKRPTHAVRALRTEAPEECGRVTESIDLEGFEWFGISASRRPCDPPAPTIHVNAQGQFRLNSTLTKEIEALVSGNRARVFVGVAPRAIALQLVPAEEVAAALLQISADRKSGSHYGTVRSRGAQQAMTAHGIPVPIKLQAKIYPEQRVIYAKVPKVAERGPNQ